MGIFLLREGLHAPNLTEMRQKMLFSYSASQTKCFSVLFSAYFNTKQDWKGTLWLRHPVYWCSFITTVNEGDYYELFGWLLPIKPRPTISKTFPNFLFPNHKFIPDTNTHGEKRAFVVTGQYESVLPMDIYPQHIMKAIMTNDFERMEGLGLAELSEEDVALCEFVCTSKMPLQSILRQGLDMMREQM